MRTLSTSVGVALVGVHLLLPSLAGAQQQVPAPNPASSSTPSPAALPGHAAPQIHAPESPVFVREPSGPAANPKKLQAVLPRPDNPANTTTTPKATPQEWPNPVMLKAMTASRCPSGLDSECRAAVAAEMLYAKRYYEALGGDLELRRNAFACPPALTAACLEAEAAKITHTKDYYEALRQELELRQQAFEWHAFSTKLLFWSVIAITAMGLVLSWREFGKYYARNVRTPVNSPATESKGTEAPPQSVFKVSAQGLEVTSSLIGFLVLSVSLAFFYLYVVNVYPLYELSGPTAKEVTASEASRTDTGR